MNSEYSVGVSFWIISSLWASHKAVCRERRKGKRRVKGDTAIKPDWGFSKGAMERGVGDSQEPIYYGREK
jgi:hypothetical protein